MYGIGLPNCDITDSEASRIRALGCEHHLDLHYFEHRFRSFKNTHVRIDVRGNYLDGIADARQVTDLYNRHPYVQSWRIRNEPNIESPFCTPTDWNRYLKVLASQVPDKVVLFIPAVSPGTPDWLDWLYAGVDAQIGFSGMDAHVYGTPVEFKTTLETLRKYYSGRLFITEYNFGAGRQYDLQRYANDWPEVKQIAMANEVEIIFPFIWRWNNPDVVLPTPVDIINTPMEPAMTETEFTVGEGFNKIKHLVGPFIEGEVYHWPNSEHEVSMAVGLNGIAVWYKTRNETYALCKNGEVWADYGNYGNGLVRRYR